MSPAAKKAPARKKAAAKKAPARKKKAAAKRAPARKKCSRPQDNRPEEHCTQEHGQEGDQEGDPEEGACPQEGRGQADNCSQEHEEGDAQEGSRPQARREEDRPQALRRSGARHRPGPAGASPVRARRRVTTRSNNSRGCTPGTTNESPNNHAGVAAIPSSRAASIDDVTDAAPSPVSSAALDLCGWRTALLDECEQRRRDRRCRVPSRSARRTSASFERGESARPPGADHLDGFERAAAVRHVCRRSERDAEYVALPSDRRVHRTEPSVRRCTRRPSGGSSGCSSNGSWVTSTSSVRSKAVRSRPR